MSFRFNEADATQVRVGQRVKVTSPGFPDLVLKGRVTSVAGEAAQNINSTSSTANFQATASLDNLTSEQAQAIRFGLTANVRIETYYRANALVVPPEAVQGDLPNNSLTLQMPNTNKIRRVSVRLGHAAPDGAEIVSGIKSGDLVVWSAKTPANDSAKP